LIAITLSPLTNFFVLQRTRTEFAGHVQSLSVLYSDGSNVESLRSRPKDLQNVLHRLNQLRTFAETTSIKINREEFQIAECQTHVQTSQHYIDQLQPWIEQGENYLNKHFDQTGALNIHDAKQLLDKHKVRKNKRILFLILILLFFI
jgi:hypothetical protein